MKQFLVDYRDPAARRSFAVGGDGSGLDALKEQLDIYGFAVADMPADVTPVSAIELLADGWDLGQPVVPALYRMPGAEQFDREIAEIRETDRSSHPGFAVRTAQDFHVDGTLDDPEETPTVVMYCVRAAHRGGNSLLFNAVAAFHDLYQRDREAASALLHPRVLRRTASLKGIDAYREGEAFRVKNDGTIVNRYSDDGIATWTPAEGQSEALARALDSIRRSSRTADSKYVASIRLEDGQALVLRNDRVSHGREAFTNSPRSPRQLLRAIYGRVPR
ncbi:TauD/TfdA family dioxygenase [Nonomuraea sp. NPDC049400]|uniref:TauD/TfdA family dioxygenase n=1 Tax=Nonomuraea sp. NPDC049400 TaxID=3364352 RepID=UPI0037B57A6B